jgi:cell division inhibitor SepF
MGLINRFWTFIGLQDEEEVVHRENVIEDMDDEDQPSSAIRGKAKGNVVSLHSKQNSRLVLTEPRSYEEAQQIADHIRSRKSAVVNLQRVRADQAIRIVDFLSGTVYALNGNISKIGPNIFLCTPDTVDVQGTITEILNDNSH